MKEKKEKVCQATLRTHLRQENRHGCGHEWPWRGVVSSQTGKPDLWNVPELETGKMGQREGKGKWELAVLM